MEGILAEEDILAEGGSLVAVKNLVEDNQAAERIPAADRGEAGQILENKIEDKTHKNRSCVHY